MTVEHLLKFLAHHTKTEKKEKLAGRNYQMLREWRREKTQDFHVQVRLRLDSPSPSFPIVVFLWLTAFHWRHICT